MSESILIKWQKYMLILTIVFLPIYNLPKAFQIPMMGGKLFQYTLAVGFVLFFIQKSIYAIQIPAKIKMFLLAVFLWGIVSTIHGIYIYPYYDAISVKQLITNEQILWRLQSFLSDHEIIVLFLLFRSLKFTFLDFFFTYFPIIWSFLLFRNKFLDGFYCIRKGCLFLCIALGLYAIPEILLFKFNMLIGKEILSITNPFLYDVNKTLGWYPPLIWQNEQLRSYCIEPSMMGGIAIVVSPLLWTYLFESHSTLQLLKYSILFIYYYMLVFMSQSRTAVVAMIYLIIFDIGNCVFKSKKIGIVILTVIAIGFSFCIIKPNYIESNQDNNFSQLEVQHEITGEKQYYNNNIATITDSKARSNESRMFNIWGHLKVGINHWFWGTGDGLKDFYIQAALSDESKMDGEIEKISSTIKSKGIKEASYGNVNEYITRFTNNGVMGLVFYLFVLFYIGYYLWKTQLIKNFYIMVLVVSMLGEYLVANMGEPLPILYIIMGVILSGVYDVEFNKTTETGYKR